MTLNTAGAHERVDPSVCRDIREMKDMPPLCVISKNTQRKDEADVSAAASIVMKCSFCCYRDDIFILRLTEMNNRMMIILLITRRGSATVPK